jgi:hypothetical protein
LSSLAAELPGELDAITIHAPIVTLRFPAQSLEIWNYSLPQTMPREESDFDLCFIEPIATVGDRNSTFGTRAKRRQMPMVSS